MKKKVALIIPDMRGGGSERMVSRLSHMLNDVFDLMVILFDDRDAKYELACDVHCLHIPASNQVFQKVSHVIKRKRQLEIVLKEKKVDLAVSFTPSANLCLGLCKTKTVKVISCRNYWDFLENQKKYAFLLKCSNYLLCNSKEMYEDIRGMLPTQKEKIVYLVNVFDDKQIDFFSEQKINEEYESFFQTHKVIINISRFVKGKGHHHLLKCFELLKKDCSDAGLLLIGEGGELEHQIQEMASRSKYKEDIRIIPFQQNPFSYIHRSHVFALSSHVEGFPNALVEAMLSKTAVVSGCCKTGAKEILIDEEGNTYGCLCPVMDLGPDFDYETVSDSERIFANTLLHVIQDDVFRIDLVNKGFAYAKKFSEAQMKDRYIDQINQLMEVNCNDSI